MLEQHRTPPLGQQTQQLNLYQYDRLGYNELRFADVIAIIEEAERGNPKRWADLTRRMLHTDPDLLAAVDSRLDGVASVPWVLDPPKGVGEADAQLAGLAVDLCSAALEQVPDFEMTQRKLLDGIGQGYAVGELVWDRCSVAVGSRRYAIWCPVEIAPIHPRRFAFTEGFELALVESYSGRELPGERVSTVAGSAIRLPRDKYIVHQPSNILDYPTATGLFSAVARYWWVKQWCIRYWLGGAEKAANQRWIGFYPQEATPAAKQQLFDALEGLAADGVGVMDLRNKIEQFGGNFQGAAAVWQELVDLCDRGFAKAWLGSTLNTDVGDSGSRALGESQADQTIEPRRRRDSRSLWCDLRRYLLEPICRYNAIYDPQGPFGGRMPPVPVGRHVFAEEPVTVDQLMVDAGAVTVDELRQSRGLPAWGDERGAAIARPAPEAPRFSALAASPPAPEVAASADPFALARRIALGWQTATPTSSVLPTSGSSGARST